MDLDFWDYFEGKPPVLQQSLYGEHSTCVYKLYVISNRIYIVTILQLYVNSYIPHYLFMFSNIPHYLLSFSHSS